MLNTCRYHINFITLSKQIVWNQVYSKWSWYNDFGFHLISGDIRSFLGRVYQLTPRKIDMEAKNHPIEKEHYLPNLHYSGQIIATSHDLTPNGVLVREILLFQGNLGWWNIIFWPDYRIPCEFSRVHQKHLNLQLELGRTWLRDGWRNSQRLMRFGNMDLYTQTVPGCLGYIGCYTILCYRVYYITL